MPYTTYATDYPQTIAPSSYDISSYTQTQMSVTQGMNTTVSDRGGQRFGIKFNYSPLVRENYAELFSFLIKQKGRFGRFTIALPNQTPRGSLTLLGGQTQHKINADVTQGNQIVVKNFAQNSSGVVKAGDFFRIGSGTKVYIACEDYDSDANGHVTITTYPNLANSISENDVVHFEPVFKVSLTSDNLTMNIPTTNNANFSVEFLESVANSGTSVTY